MSIPIRETLQAFVDIPSLSGAERAFANHLARKLREWGLTVRELPLPDGRCNLLAQVGTPRVLFCTHLDTVPPFLPFEVRDGAWFGRGTCDAKGVLLAQILALLQLRDEGRDDVGLLAVVSEETMHEGAKAAANEEVLQGAWVILGEPTGNTPVHAQKGLLKLHLQVSGKACHSGYPERGRSALLPLLDLFQAVRDEDWPVDPELGATTCNIGWLQAGVAANVLPPNAEAQILFRAVGPTAQLEERVRTLAVPEISIEAVSRSEPQRLFVPEGWSSKAVAFNTDAAYLGEGPARISLLGPGYIEHAHSPEERITEAGLKRGVELYAKLVREHSP